MFTFSKKIYVKALYEAQKKGIIIDIIIGPKHQHLLEQTIVTLDNIKFTYQIANTHTKLMIVDTKIVATGSFN